MTIHSSHPFEVPAEQRNQLRRLRGRLAAPVTVWTAHRASDRPVGLTVSSVLLADGQPPVVLGLIDPDADLLDGIRESGRFAVNVLSWPHRQLADAMAGLAPAPGGAFRLGEWTATPSGPVLVDSAGWLTAGVEGEPVEAGYSLLVRGRVTDVHVGTVDPLQHLLGRYRQP